MDPGKRARRAEAVLPTLPVGAVVAVEVDDDEFVVWRGHDGAYGSAPRWCPHLDHDLAEGYVDGDELVCAGHGWAFTRDGRMFKRNEFGRVDSKGDVPTLLIRDDAEHVVVELRRAR